MVQERMATLDMIPPFTGFSRSKAQHADIEGAGTSVAPAPLVPVTMGVLS